MRFHHALALQAQYGAVLRRLGLLVETVCDPI